ncbi:ABC transporter substrate-binding protein [Paenibacillus radicis (ex Gao et al. 2016)]|uniref:Siderophore-binding lipoprotein YfiY n=1 Tax=Paenibacillus radicis (ex Gao et al. 2016) TaxID=1737354 RepID=A0A917HTA6_9BACL|nr:ABC transporter substrate-binding protein [Paenibacillus radicis (ex Gao et al. 2016)]GGG88547.1 putative siderophore-binding lipoprotein YfiY [Paenibacillus radicis (ex Gao et al. 2016)]
MFYVQKYRLIAAILLLATALYGCSSANNTAPAANETATPQASPRTVNDDLGNQVKIPANPQRIVAPYLEDALLALGVTPAAQWSAGNLLLNYLQPQLKDVPKLDFVSLDPEAVLSFSPDLFIIPFAARVQNGAYDQYANVAPTYVFQDATKDWKKTLLTLADLLNKTDQANEALKQYDTKMAEIKSALQDKTAGKRAAIMLISDKSFSLMQENTYSGKVVYGELGMQVPAGAEGNDWKELSLENLPELKADYIFLMQVDGADPLKNTELSTIYNTSVWKNLDAVKSGHVYSVDRDYWINTGLNANLKIADDVQKLLANP